MKKETRRRLSELILEELSERIRQDESLREKLEPFTELPVEKVAETLLKHIDLLLTEDFRDALNTAIQPSEPDAVESALAPVAESVQNILPEKTSPPPATIEETSADVSIMKHFSLKEAFPFEAFNLKLSPDDWFYLFGFSYAPDSTGKGVPNKMLSMKSIDKSNNIFLVDSGDIRLYVSKLSVKEYSVDTANRPVPTPHQDSRYKFEHELILNTLRAEESIVVLPHWTIFQGMEEVLGKIEEKYVDLLKLLVEMHDTVEWDLDLFAFDHHILQLPSITAGTKSRSAPRREPKAPPTGRKNDVMIDKVIFREKSIAQDIHNQLDLTATKGKVDYMIRLDTAFMDDWKSILSVRYAVPKDKRKSFWQAVKTIQDQYREYELMMKFRAKADHFTF